MVFNRLLRRLKRRSSQSGGSKKQRRLRIESLIKRELLASDIGAVGGVAFVDLSGDGLTNDDTRLNNVTVEIFSDAALTTPAAPDVLTNAQGEYRFDDLSPGQYFVRQADVPGLSSGGVVTVNVVNDTGDQIAIVDDYTQTFQDVAANTGETITNSLAAPEAIGGSRDVQVINTATGQLGTLFDNVGTQLSVGAQGGATGSALIQYDGADGSINLDAVTGLGGITLAGGMPGDALEPNAGLNVLARAADAQDDLTITIYSSPTAFSSRTITIPQTAQFGDFFVPFNTFTDTGGGADFNNVTAIETFVELDVPDNDVVVQIVDTVRPEVVPANLANTQLVALGGTVFSDNNAAPEQNNAVLDPGELGIANVVVELYRRNPVTNSIDPVNEAAFLDTVTDANGNYNFPNLEPDDYQVVIPDSQFAGALPLVGFTTSTANDPAPDPDDDVDNDDNGSNLANVGVASQVITLVSEGEPINDADTDPNTNTTVDFGFFPQVDVTVEKTLDPVSVVQAGGTAIFDIRVENLGPGVATNVVVTDVLPAGLTFDAATSDFNGFANNVDLATGTIEVTIGTLTANAPGNVATFTIGTRIDDNRTEDITNTAAVVAFEVETDENNNDDPEVVDLTSADLVIAKVGADNPVAAGNALVYRITVTNNGPDAAEDVVITDTLPVGTTLVEVNNPTLMGVAQDPVDPQLLTIPIGDLANQASVEVTVTVDVAENAASPLNNVASVVATPDNDPVPGNNDTNEETVVEREVDVAINKTVAGTPVAGGNVEYTIVVTNNGPSEARNVSVSDVLAADLSFVSFDAQGSGVSETVAGQNLTFDVGTLAAQATRTFSFIAAIASSATGVIPNLAEVTTSDPDTDDTNDESPADITVVQQTDLILEKTVDRATAVPGQDQLVYTFTIRHDAGSISDATNVVLTDQLPDGVTGAIIGAANDDSRNFDNATNTVTVSFNAIPVGTTETFTVTVNVDEDATGDIVNPASITADNDDDPANNNSSATTTVNPQFDVTVTKAVDDTTPAPGQTITYDLSVTNSGPSTATGVVLSDAIPAGLSFVSGTLNGLAASNSGTTITFPALTLTDDQTVTGNLVFTVNNDAAGTIVNTATVTADNGETNLNNNDDDATITVTPEVDITVAKSVNAEAIPEADPGDTLTYTIVVTNNGPSAATNVTARDTLPTGVTFVSGTGPNGEALSASNRVVTVTQPTLASGQDFTFTINATVNAGVTAAQTNQVTVSTDTSETNLNNNDASVIVQIATIDPRTSSIAGTVYLDANANGVQDANEVGIAGVAVSLSGTDNDGAAVSQNATTDANGDYIFANLAAGTYTVNETQPTGFRDGQESLGQNATATLGDDVFTQLGLGEAIAATEFDFGELAESLSKRRFLASS